MASVLKGANARPLPTVLTPPPRGFSLKFEAPGARVLSFSDNRVTCLEISNKTVMTAPICSAAQFTGSRMESEFPLPWLPLISRRTTLWQSGPDLYDASSDRSQQRRDKTST
jgi:hypothetical protein